MASLTKVAAGKSEIRRILIIKWSALGDVALATAAMDDVYRAFPHAELHLDTSPASARLFIADPRFSRVYTLPMRDRTARLRTHFAWLRRVRAARYDLIVDLQSSDHTRLMVALMAFGRTRVGARWGLRRGFPYTLAPPPHSGPHPATRMRALMRLAGIEVHARRPVLYPGDASCKRVGTLLREHNIEPRRYAVFLPGSQAAGWLKRWGVARYAELGIQLIRRGIDRVVIIGGHDEADDCTAIAERINATTAGVAVVLESLSLLEIIPACAEAVVIISGDTGSAHIAAATDRPMWVLCGPTDPRRVRPFGNSVHAVQAEFDCLNCYRKSCRFGPQPVCLRRIAPSAVLQLAMDGVESIPGLRVFSAQGA